MINALEEKLNHLIKCEIDPNNYEFRQWFLKQFKCGAENVCTLEEFSVYFLNTLRQHTEIHIKTSNNEAENAQTPVRTLKSFGSKEELETPQRRLNLSQPNIPAPNNNNISVNNSQSKNNSKAEFDNQSSHRLSTSLDRLGVSHHNSDSLPVKHNGSRHSRRLSITPECTNKSGAHSLCLGDFLLQHTPTTSRSQKKKTTPTTSQQSGQKPQCDKPKKRLQPTTINKKVEKNQTTSIFAGESSFSNENNILKLSNTELEDKDQCAILAARKSLVLNASEITKEIENVSLPLMPAVTDIVATSTPVKKTAVKEISLDLTELQKNVPLKMLAKIYSLIINLNINTNILNELSFLLNLLNASSAKIIRNEECIEINQINLDAICSDKKGLSMLEDLAHAIYFALLCLEHEKHSLASLDAKSLSVVLTSERFSYLSDEVRTYLMEIYQRKQQLMAEKPFCETYLQFDSKACNNVPFQHEHDSKNNFSSQQEFNNFRAQRDLFYKCLKIWKTNHLNPNWMFLREITPKIKEIFYISENCINMAHLAKLFVSQLLLSASNSSSAEEIGLDVDQEKLSKLTQRLIAPSQFSVEYQFPRTEAFFHDFILHARSLAFVEQLKMELCTQLITQNESSLDNINIGKDENDAGEPNVSAIGGSPRDQFIVRPDILNSLLILAKFLGFTISLPYNMGVCNSMPSKLENNQVKLRSLIQATFNLSVLLEQAIEESKLLIVIPWLVQYVAMLDNVTLQVENCKKTLKILFALYSYLGLEDPKPFCPTSQFIMKICLGWLFYSKQIIAEQYYNYRVKLNSNSSEESSNEFDFVKSKLRRNIVSFSQPEIIRINAHLESLLPVACPFLAEFRVSIMPAKYAQTKNASRSGRYRHITTRIAELACSPPIKDESPSNADQNKTNMVQRSLIQAFLSSQNSSTRSIIKFCTENCYKSTVKDGQVKILLPAKANADNLVNQITSYEYNNVYSHIKTIYGETYAQVKEDWKECIGEILQKRIKNALDSLLPEETALVLKRTYFMIIEKEAKVKIYQWFYGNIIRDQYFSPNLVDMANKICSANKNKVQLGSNLLTLFKETPSVSDLLDELQYWLHCTSIRMDRFQDAGPLVLLFTNFINSFDNELPSSFYNLVAGGIIQLLQNIISSSCSHLSDELIETACAVWLHPNTLKALESFYSSNICIYDKLLNTIFIASLGSRPECFHQLGRLIIVIIKKQIMTVNYINELFVSIFKYDWHPLVLREISYMLKSIATEVSAVPQKRSCKNNANNNENGSDIENDDEDDKSNLFMEMLADLSRDVDDF